MFAMVVLFGLIHGLVLLPICLSLVGPLPPVEEEGGGDPAVELINGKNGHIRYGRHRYIQLGYGSDFNWTFF